MKLPEICIRYPVFASVLNLILIVIGLVGYAKLDLRFFPEIQMPIMTISTNYEGAGPQLIENGITQVIENQLASVENIESITSSSSNSWSTINIRFKLGGDFNAEVNAVRDKVSSARKDLPPSAELPFIEVGGRSGIALSIGFTDNKKTSAEIRDYVARYVWPQLREVQGVGAVDIFGASDYAMRIWLNSEKMAVLDVTVKDVEAALRSNNIEFPAGRVQDPQRNFTVISDTKLKSPEDFAKIIVLQRNGQFIRFRDIAAIKLGYRSLQDSPLRLDGKPGVDVEVKPLKTANPITVATEIKKVLAKITPSLPAGMHAAINYDQSLFLKAAIHEAFSAIFEAIVLVVLVVFLFLGSLRASTIPIVTIPICIIATFGLMYMAHFSINIMTLLAIVLAIGLVVDDAIVMLENIHRHIEHGLTAFQAAIKGSKEIALAIVAMTLTLAAVYAPLGFAEGYTSVIFKEFAFTLAGAVLISGFVALTLSPMMSSLVLQPHKKENRLMLKIDALFNHLSVRYQHWLRIILRKRLHIIVSLAVFALIGIIIYQLMPAEFIPQEDTGLVVTSVGAPTGSNLDYTDKYMRQIEQFYAKIPEISSYYTVVFSGSAVSYATLKPWGERHKTTQAIAKLLAPQLSSITGVDAYPSIPDPIDYGFDNTDVSVQLLTAAKYEDLLPVMDKLVAHAKKFPGFQNVRSSMRYDDQQFAITINRDLAADLSINIQDIADTVRVMLGGAHITDFIENGRSYVVLVQMQQQDLENFRGFNKLYVRSGQGRMVPLSSLIKLTPVIGQASLSHYNRMRAATMTAKLNPGYSVNDAAAYLQKLLPTVVNPKIRYDFSGKIKQFMQASSNMLGIFLLALVFIYLVLAAQFGSFIDPLIILFTVPLSMVGALLTLYLAGGSISLYSQIGLITLVGMITKHGILITEFTNKLREQGMDLLEAVVQASATRLRPILMTTFAMVLGSIPLALASGPGSIGRMQIGWVIVGGLTFGTFFSLVVVPVAYSYLGKLKYRWVKNQPG
jgi:multidrug efflux pump